jgi:hypothetical protein
MRTRRAIAMLMLLAAGSLAACHRKPQFVPAEADSTSAGSVDSASVRLRQAQNRWEAGPSPEAAATVVAALADRIQHQQPSDWKSAADALLDSLGVGAETASAECLLAVNLFSRSDPASGSWPYLLWCGSRGPLAQAIEGKGLHLFQLVARGDPRAKRTDCAAAALFGSRGAGGQQPLLMMWRLGIGDRWSLAQTLGPDSLGGVGTGEFRADSDTAIDLVTRTYRTPRYFEECATCPHLYRTRRFRWGAAGFERAEEVAVDSPYSTFVQFIQALMAGDRDQAARLVTNPSLVDQAHRLDWGTPKGVWRIAPAMDESPSRMTFFRGEREAYAVQFAQQGQSWLIAGFESAPRTVE